MKPAYFGPERRQFPRVPVNFVVSYVIKRLPDDYDLTKTKNVSRGGMLITTNKYFEKGVKLFMTIRYAFIPRKIEVIGEVVACKERVKNLIYETRIKFINLDSSLSEKIGEEVKKFQKKPPRRIAERRKHLRVDANFVVSYAKRDIIDEYDLSQTRDLSQGGILLTTHRYYENGVRLALVMRFPFVSKKVEALAEVVHCREVAKDLIYETRLKFLNLDMSLFEEIGANVKKMLEE